MRPRRHKVSPKNENYPIVLNELGADRTALTFHKMLVVVWPCCPRQDSTQAADMALEVSVHHKSTPPPAHFSAVHNSFANSVHQSAATLKLHADQTVLSVNCPGSDRSIGFFGFGVQRPASRSPACRAGKDGTRQS